MPKVLLNDICYKLGEKQCIYSEATSFARVLKEYKIPDMKEMFGWGYFYKTSHDIFSIGVNSAKETIRKSEIQPEDIDLVIFCSTEFPGTNDLGYEQSYEYLLEELSLIKAFVMGITINNCCSTLSAIQTASALIHSGEYENILIISSDTLTNEENRFTDYALFSDSAMSFIMSLHIPDGFEIIAHSFLSDYKLISDNDGLADAQLFKDVNDSIFSQVNIQASDIKKVFSINVYKPIVGMKEARVGITINQLYLDNISNNGHCFSADPLINLSDYCQDNELAHGEYFMLTTSANGLRAAQVIRYSSGPH